MTEVFEVPHISCVVEDSLIRVLGAFLASVAVMLLTGTGGRWPSWRRDRYA